MNSDLDKSVVIWLLQNLPVDAGAAAGLVKALLDRNSPIGAHIAKIEAGLADENNLRELAEYHFEQAIWVQGSIRDRAERAEAKTATLTARLAEVTETYTDEAGTVWSPPTAWAYAQACKALNAKIARLDEVEAALEPFADAGDAIDASSFGNLSDDAKAPVSFTIGDFRAARSALSNKEAGHE